MQFLNYMENGPCTTEDTRVVLCFIAQILARSHSTE